MTTACLLEELYRWWHRGQSTFILDSKRRSHRKALLIWPLFYTGLYSTWVLFRYTLARIS